MKKQLKDLKDQVKVKEEEIGKMKRDLKFTNMVEVKVLVLIAH